LAVLPLENLSGDESKAYICDGITQEIIHLLTHCRELQLLASGTTFHYRTSPDRIHDVGLELNVDYVLYGSIRIGDKEIRVTAFLFDVHLAQNVWAEQYRHTLSPANIFEIQDNIAAVIVGQVSNPHGMLNRLSRTKEIDNFSAYAAVLRFYAYQESMDPESHLAAKVALEQAVSMYPNYAEAWGCLSAVYGGEHMFGFNVEPDAKPPLDRALAAAKRALQLVPDCIIGLYSLANCYYYRRELPDFRIAAQRAIELAPNRSDMLSGLALHIAYDGQWERGLKMLDNARNLNPLHPGWFWFPYALNAYRHTRYEEALRYAKQINMPSFYWDHVFLAMIYGQLGQSEEAKIHLNQSVMLRPDLVDDPETIIATIVLDSALAHHCVEGLVKAGLKISSN
jgi:TolB-like protein/Tfp pilus assembly protein PilF